MIFRFYCLLSLFLYIPDFIYFTVHTYCTCYSIIVTILYYTIGAVPLNSLTQSSSFPIHYNNLNCVGNETNVYDCPELNTTMCTTNNAAIVACQYG